LSWLAGTVEDSARAGFRRGTQRRCEAGLMGRKSSGDLTGSDRMRAANPGYPSAARVLPVRVLLHDQGVVGDGVQINGGTLEGCATVDSRDREGLGHKTGGELLS